MLSRLWQTRRFINTVVHNMPEGISQHLFLPKGRGLGLKDGMLDKESFRKVFPVLAAKVAPEKAGVLLKSSVMKRYAAIRRYIAGAVLTLGVG